MTLFQIAYLKMVKILDYYLSIMKKFKLHGGSYIFIPYEKEKKNKEDKYYDIIKSKLEQQSRFQGSVKLKCV